MEYCISTIHVNNLDFKIKDKELSTKFDEFISIYKKVRRKKFVLHTFDGSNIPDSGENIWRHKNRTFCNTYGKSYELINNEWVNVSWSGGSPTYARDIWTDGEKIYYKLEYEIDVDNLRLTRVTFKNAPSSFRGEYVWTDGENVYFCQGTSYYVLDKDTLTWSTTTFTGSFPYIYSNNIWTDGFDIYLGNKYVLSKTTKRKFESTSWSGIDTDFDGYNVWTDGENLYESMSGTTYLIDVPTKTARKITLFDDNKAIKGYNIWSDGKNIYHTESNETHILIEEKVNLHKYY